MCNANVKLFNLICKIKDNHYVSCNNDNTSEIYITGENTIRNNSNKITLFENSENNAGFHYSFLEKTNIY